MMMLKLRLCEFRFKKNLALHKVLSYFLVLIHAPLKWDVKFLSTYILFARIPSILPHNLLPLTHSLSSKSSPSYNQLFFFSLFPFCKQKGKSFNCFCMAINFFLFKEIQKSGDGIL